MQMNARNFPMGLCMENAINDIRLRLAEKRYTNEAQVSQGIVQRLLRELGWDTSDIDTVYPEYPLSGLRVDFALCYPPAQPMVFIEIKQVGRSEGADEQLFEYAFREGIPLGILTDGQIWSFYLPSGQGDYGERQVYILDILERDVTEIIYRFRRYLDYKRVCSEEALEAVRQDYRDARNERRAKSALPSAWNKLVEERDELLIELIASKVESLSGYKPTTTAVVDFLSNELSLEQKEPIKKLSRSRAIQRAVNSQPQSDIQVNLPLTENSYQFRGEKYTFSTGKEVFLAVLKRLSDEDETFLSRFALVPKHGTKRRYISQNKQDLFPGRDDLLRVKGNIYEIKPGWFVGTHNSDELKLKIIQMACTVANLKYGQDLTVQFK